MTITPRELQYLLKLLPYDAELSFSSTSGVGFYLKGDENFNRLLQAFNFGQWQEKRREEVGKE